MTRIEDRNSLGGQVVWFVALSLIGIVFYSWSLHVLKQPFDFYFAIALLVPCGYYYWKYPTKKQGLPPHELLSRKVALVLLAYSFVYFVLIYFVHILAASIALWLVQFMIPVIILKVSKVRLSAIGFEWKRIFRNFSDVIMFVGKYHPGTISDGVVSGVRGLQESKRVAGNLAPCFSQWVEFDLPGIEDDKVLLRCHRRRVGPTKPPNNGMQRTRIHHVSHAGQVSSDGSCALTAQR